MYQCIFIHILCRRGCNLMDIFFRCDRSIRSTSIIFEFLFVLLEHKIFYTSTMGLMRIHTLIILIIIWREKKKLFWQYYIDDIIQKMVKKLGVCVNFGIYSFCTYFFPARNFLFEILLVKLMSF